MLTAMAAQFIITLNARRFVLAIRPKFLNKMMVSAVRIAKDQSGGEDSLQILTIQMSAKGIAAPAR